MKRHFNLLASVLLVIAMVFALASCDLIDKIIPGTNQPDPQPEHEHAYVDGSCECGEADPNYVAPHEHNFVEGKCECGETDPNYTVPECAEHAYGAPEVTKEATCTESGERKLTCTVCGYSETKEIAPSGHNEEDIPGKAATCTEAGLSTGSQCTVCGTVTEAQVSINPKGHSFVEGACSACGEVDPEYNGPKTYVLDVQTLSAFAAGAKADGETELVADFFTIYYSAKTKIDTTKNKTWPDGYTFAEGLRLNWGGTTAIGETTKNAIEIVVDGTATVKVWWICGGDGREIGIFDENGDLVVASQTEDVFTEGTEGVGAGKNGVYLSELSLDAAGKYYIGTDCTNAIKEGGNIICKVEVTVTPAEEVEVPEIKVETTDTYGWFDEYSFTANAEGYYTFAIPAGLGFCSKAQFDKYAAPELDYQKSPNGGDVVVGLKEGETLVFYVGAITKGNWTITWSFEAGEVEDGPVGPSVEIDTELEVGVNSIYITGGFGATVDCTFAVTEEGTYTFASGNLMAVITMDDGTQLRGQAYLVPGTYNVTIVSYASMDGYYDINVQFAAPVTGEPNGSEEFPYIWDTIPESVTLDYAVVSGKVYYIFTATADGTITFTWPVEGDSWYDIFELDANGNTTSNNASGFMKNSHSFMVEAGKSYRVSLGSWSEVGSHTIAISFVSCNHVWSEATCTAPSTCENCGATTGSKAEHTSTVANPTCANPDICAVCEMELSYIPHEFDDGVVTTPADCATGTEGSITYTCTVCGGTQVDTLWAYHDWVVDVENYATCTENGRYEAHCSVCNEVDAYDIEAQGHYNYFLSCGDSGECMECGETFTVEHNTVWAPATCTDPAYCYNCWSYVGEPLGHNYSAVVTAPTCSAAGYTTYTCENCSDSYTADETAALEHDYDHVVTAPTCTAAGYTTHTCAFCDYSYTDTEVEALGHADANGDYKCDKCSTAMLPADGTALTIPQALAVAKVAGTSYSTQKYYITGIIKSVYNTTYGNLYLVDDDGNEITIYGLYTADGKTRYDAMSYKPVTGDELTVYTILGMYNTTCQGKNAWMDEVVAHEHNYTSVVTDPTCTKGGYTTHTCSICDGYYVDSEVEATGHTTDNGVCDNCGQTIGGDVVANETFKADFDTVSATNSSYVTSTTTSGWKATNCAVMGGGTSDSNPKFKVFGAASTRAFTLNGKTSAKGKLVSPTIADGLSKLTFNYTNCFSESNGVDITITVYQNGTAVASKKLDNNSVTKLTAYTFEWDLAAEGVAVSGDFTIEITNNSPTNSTSNKDRVSIWNLEWTTNK